MISYNNKRFGMVSTSTGASMPPRTGTYETIFDYRQDGDVVWGTFDGGSVRKGTFVATVDAAGVLDLRYAYVNQQGELLTGTSVSTPEVLADGRIRLHEVFAFTSGDRQTGVSVVEELPN